MKEEIKRLASILVENTLKADSGTEERQALAIFKSEIEFLLDNNEHKLRLPSNEEILNKANNWFPASANKAFPKDVECRDSKREGYILGMIHLRDYLDSKK